MKRQRGGDRRKYYVLLEHKSYQISKKRGRRKKQRIPVEKNQYIIIG